MIPGRAAFVKVQGLQANNCKFIMQPPEMFYKKGVLKNFANSQESNSVRVYFLIKLQAWSGNFIKKETLTQVF